MANAFDSLIPGTVLRDPETTRRARLLVRFGFLGACFGGAYSLFYLLIQHYLGAAIIFVCSSLFLSLPFSFNRTRNLRLTSNVFALTLTIGFTGLSIVEGGMHGHAVVWLAGVPLCALLIADRMDAFFWSIVSTAVATVFGVCHLTGFDFPITYPERWIPSVDAAGYAGLVPFMTILGYVFEDTRRRAFSKLQGTLADLSAANDKLTRVNKDKSEFLNIAAHDLKNPLSVISGYADLMRQIDGFTDEEITQHSTEILSSANRMLDIITNLLDVQAIEEGKMNLKVEPCPIEDLTTQLVRDYSQAAEKKQIDIRVSVPEDIPSFKGDCSAVFQILDNLFSNAIKYSPPGSKVDLATRSDGKVCIVEVIDEGPGLSKEDQQKLFKKFSRLTPQPTGGESSNGLGLWIVNRMAESMCGRVYCKSVLDEGSTFGLVLPAWNNNSDGSPEGSANRQSPGNNRGDGKLDGLILPS